MIKNYFYFWLSCCHLLVCCLLAESSPKVFPASSQEQISREQISRVAIIGGGGSGLITAWLLDKECAVTLYEAQERLGGHANTIEVEIDGAKVPIEAGFEFISDNQFPYFCHFLKNILQIPLHQYTLTTNYYHTNGKRTLILPPLHDGIIEWKSWWPNELFTMLQLKRLIDSSKKMIEIAEVGITLENFVEQLFITPSFKNDFLYPFLAANFGVTSDDIKQFSAYNALKYLVLGSEANSYQWLEVVGGTQRYIQATASQLEHTKVVLATQIADIRFDGEIYTIQESGGNESQYDHVIIATNAAQASELLINIDSAASTRAILDKVEYFKTKIALHGDCRFMPKNRSDWRVVNIRSNGISSAITVCKEWLHPTRPIFKSWLTYDVRPAKDTAGALPNPLYALVEYDHPKVNLKYFEAQKAIAMIQGTNNLWLVGNYTFDNDSHESALRSALHVASQLAPQAERLHLLTTIPSL